MRKGGGIAPNSRSARFAEPVPVGVAFMLEGIVLRVALGDLVVVFVHDDLRCEDCAAELLAPGAVADGLADN